MSDPSPSPAARADTAEPTGASADLATILSLHVGVAIVLALYFAREVFIPLALAVLLSFALAPVVLALRRLRIGRVPAVLLAVAAALCIILGIGAVIGSQVAQLVGNVPQYASTVEDKIDSIRGLTVGRITSLTDMIGRHPTQPQPAPAAQAAPPQAAPAPTQAAQPAEEMPRVLVLAQRFLSPVLSPIATLGIVFVVAIFILAQQEDLRDRLIRLFGAQDLHRTTIALDEGASKLARYLLSQLAINTSFGVVIALGLFVIGVPNPILWGMLGAMLRFVPYVGAVIAGALPALLAAAVDPGWSMAIWTVVLFVLIEVLVGQVVEPLVYGHSTGLSPVAVVIAAIVWSWMWGPIGLILSTPLTLVLVVLGRHVERLQFLDILLGDRPALSPMENFYQRVLAGDADEAQDCAERMIKDHSLDTYYDEVVIKGLQMATADADRGVLHATQLARVKTTIRELLAGLVGDPAEPAQGTPAPPRAAGWQGEAPVMCLAGRGPLDDTAAEMLVHLLAEHGIGAKAVPHEAASRETIWLLNGADVAMVCIVALDVPGSIVNLRYLVQRLRRRLPRASLLVAVWPQQEDARGDERLRTVIGADHYVGSLGEAVAWCERAAHPAIAEVEAAA